MGVHTPTMYRLLLLTLTLAIVLPINADIFDDLPKCCESESVFNSSLGDSANFTCVKDPTLRLQILVNESRIDKNHSDYCLEIYNNSVHHFQKDDNNFIRLKQLNVDYIPKCCPLGYLYKSSTHACIKTDVIEPILNEKVVKVGLPQCKIILDSGTDALNALEKFPAALKSRNLDSFCIDRNEKDGFVIRTCEKDYGICKSKKCVLKCCPDGQSFVNGKFCKDTYVHGVDLSVLKDNVEDSDAPFVVIHGIKNSIYPLTSEYKFTLNAMGVFSIKEAGNVTFHHKIEESEYCIEHAFKHREVGAPMNNYTFFRPFPPDGPFPLKFVMTRIAMYISCVFLTLTIVYYCISSERHILFGKIIISYCVAALLLFSSYIYLSFDVKRPKNAACHAIAFTAYYLLLAFFTWTNVLSVDIYWTFGSFKSSSSFRNKNKDLKRFIFYSLYGWGAPLLLTGLVAIFHKTDVLPLVIAIQISVNKCILASEPGNYGKILFLVLYLTILQLINLVLFIKTAMCCLKVKKEIAKMNDTNNLKSEKKRFNNIRDRLSLLIKLFLIMGASYTFEIVSLYYDFKTSTVAEYIEIIWDTINSLQGFLIFVVFIFKKRILRQFRTKVGLRKLSSMSVNMTQTTALAPTTKK